MIKLNDFNGDEILIELIDDFIEIETCSGLGYIPLDKYNAVKLANAILSYYGENK